MNISEFESEFRRRIILEGDEYSTAKRYCTQISLFMRYYQNQYDSPLKIPTRDIENYVLYLRENKYSNATINQFIAAAKRFYKINGQPRKCDSLCYHEKIIKTKNILTIEEAIAMCNTKVYIKHQAVINLLYYGALRRGELQNLKIKDVSSDRRINIVESKQSKSRVITVPERLLVILRQYYKECRPTRYLFNGEGTRPKYSAKSIENIVKNVAALCGITKDVHPHLLRASRATHLLDNGASDMYVSQFLGHSKLQTTKDYYCNLTLNGMQDNFDRVDNTISQKINPGLQLQ